MAINFDLITETFEWLVSGAIFGYEYEFTGVFNTTSNTRKGELLHQIGLYEQLLQSDPTSPDLNNLGIRAIAQEVFVGWSDPNGEMIWQGQPLPSNPQNVEWMLNEWPGVDMAIVKAWFTASNGERARLGNSESLAGFGQMVPRSAGRRR